MLLFTCYVATSENLKIIQKFITLLNTPNHITGVSSMSSRSKRILNTIKTYRMSPVMSCKLNKLAIKNKVPEAELVRDILAKFIEASGL